MTKDQNNQLKQNIGQLRQYLNERTSADLITNEEIEVFILNKLKEEL
jgi:hypothetical protein